MFIHTNKSVGWEERSQVSNPVIGNENYFSAASEQLLFNLIKGGNRNLLFNGRINHQVIAHHAKK